MSEMLDKNSWIESLDKFYNSSKRIFNSFTDAEVINKPKSGLVKPRTEDYDLEKLGLTDYDPNDTKSLTEYGLAGYLSSTEDVDMMNLENPSDVENELAKLRGAAPFGEMESRLGDLKLDVPKDLRGVFKNADQWNTFKEIIGRKESLGQGFNAVGGKNNAYDGKWQMGKIAKQAAANYLDEDSIGHTKEARKMFRNDPELQEKYYAAFVSSNHKKLLNSNAYKNLSNDDKIGVLGYAQQGVRNARDYVEQGVVSVDANGVPGTAYIDALVEQLNLNVTSPEIFKNIYNKSLRPKLRP